MTSIPLVNASLCVECESLSDSTGSCCVCGSQAILNLSKLLGGPLGTDRAKISKTAQDLFFESMFKHSPSIQLLP